MRILINGNMGYIGSVLARHLREVFPEAELIGFDTGFFSGCLLDRQFFPEVYLDRQHFGDVRDFPAGLLRGVDAVVQLAAVSNDPMGNAFEQPTMEINHQAAVGIARLARQAGVSHFVFASSCSVYGAGGEGARDESSEVNPLTAYARSKIACERDLAALANSDFLVTSLRFATACGMSPRLRLDLVLNDFVAGAITSGQIAILSDGTPWRPLIHVDDMARAIEWACTRREEQGGPNLIVNTGSNHWNYQVRDLAYAVQEELGNVEVRINADASPDKRSYKVDFSYFKSLAPEHYPKVPLSEAVRGLAEGLSDAGFNDPEFRNSDFIRLKILNALKAKGRITENLSWALAPLVPVA